MELNFTACQDILKTLPISLYLGRDGISAEVSETEDVSYYNPLEDRIVISYPSFTNLMSHIKSTKDLDGIIRGILYHEISHALLTPKYLKQGYSQHEGDILNVFEDERIETILSDFYYGVDFKKNCILLNDYHGEAPKDAFGDFYTTVRFRNGKPKFLSRVNAIIENNWSLNSSEEHCYTNYPSQVLALYYDIAKEWLEENSPDKFEQEAQKMNGIGDSSGSSSAPNEGEENEGDSSGSSTPTYDALSDSGKKEVVKRILEQQAKENGGYGEFMGMGDGDPMPGEGSDDKPMMGGKWHIPDYSDEVNAKDDIDKLTEASHNATDELDKGKVQKMLDSMMNHFIDSKLTDEIAMIFENFTSRSKNNSAAIPRYSGVINPRAFARDDWRIFEYKSTSGPVKGYDKLHLNLFIDTSGSYYNNEDKTNTILKSLITLEDKYPFFYFDLVTMQRTETLRSKKERYIRANGGNDLDDKVKDIYKQLQHPQSFNYNIILFDGDAFTDTPRGLVESHKQNFGIFNNSKCSIISDSDNKDAIERYAPLSHHIFVGCGGRNKSYSALLYDNIIESLTRALL